MDARHAHILQQHALNALAELRCFLGSRELELASPALAPQTERQAVYAAWGAQVDAALRAVGKAFPESEQRLAAVPNETEPEVESSPPTLPSRGAGRASAFRA